MKKYINKTLVLLFATVAFSSCLKDDSYVLDPDKAGANLIEWQNPTDNSAPGTAAPLYIYSFPIISTPTPVTLTVSYSGAELVAPNDITVNISVDNAALAQYNTDQGKSALLMPATYYNLSAMSVVIPKGKKTASITASFNTSVIDLTKTYILPLKLTSTNAVVSKNFGTALFQVGAKNKYDGIYKMNAGFFQRFSGGAPTTNDALNGTMEYNADITLMTIDANTVEIIGMRWGSSVPNTGSGSGVAGINNLQAVIDPVTNLVTMKSLGNATLANTAGQVNKYDPVTKQFTLNFNWNPTGAARTVTGMKFTYKGVRP